MKAVFVDANVFLRFFTLDDEGQHERAAALLRKAAAGKVVLVSGPPVLFEIAWTLRSAYGLPRDRVLDVLARIAGMPGLRLTDSTIVEAAVAVAGESGQEFADAYVVAIAREAGATAVATFNRKHFDRMRFPLHPF